MIKVEPNAMPGVIKKSRDELLESIKNQIGCNLLIIDLNNASSRPLNGSKAVINNCKTPNMAPSMSPLQMVGNSISLPGD